MELIQHAVAKGSPLKCESQGVLRVAACGSSFYGSVLCAFGLGMLDADGWFFTYLWLATSWFVSGGCACYLSFRFLSLGGSGNLKQEGAEGAERLHPYRQTNKECH